MKRNTGVFFMLLIGTVAGMLGADGCGAQDGQSPLENLPPHITRLTHFGQRADWSHDGRRILFIEKTYGDVYEVDLQTRTIRPMTHHYYHEGYTRALYLSNGDILLSGAPEFDARNPGPSRHTQAQLWVLKKDLSARPVALGTKCSEGPAVSRRRLRIAWTLDHGDYPDRMPEGTSQIWMADIVYKNGKPELVNKKKILDSRDLPFRCGLETQNFRPPDEKELIFSAYGYQGTEVAGLNLETGKVVNYSNAPNQYDEPEGIFHDGRFTCVECDKHDPRGSQHIDIYKLALDGSGKTERLTFFNTYPGYKASNPVISDDGHFMAFQMAKVGDPAGVGRGIFIFDFAKAGAVSERKGAGSAIPFGPPASRATESRVNAARATIRAFELALDTYEVDMGAYPKSLEALLRKPAAATAGNWSGPYVKGDRLPTDPWGNEYRYTYPGKHNKYAPDVWSAGPDGRSGTEDDITNWERSGK